MCVYTYAQFYLSLYIYPPPCPCGTKWSVRMPSGMALEALVELFKGPTPPGLAQPCMARVTSHDFFSIIFCPEYCVLPMKSASRGVQRTGFWALGPILEPTWPPRPPRPSPRPPKFPKTLPKSPQEPPRPPQGPILNRFWAYVGPLVIDFGVDF